VGRRDGRLEVGGVDHAAADLDDSLLVGPEASHQLTSLDGPAVVVAAEEPHPARGLQRHQRAVEVVAYLGSGRELVEARVGPGRLDALLAQRQRVDPVRRRRLVQPDEGIGVAPVTTRTAAAVDDHHVGVDLGEERVDEGQRRRATAHHEVVGLGGPHARPSGHDRR
jgi:hypothetical protein